MHPDYLTSIEQEAYDDIIERINRFVFYPEYQKEIIDKLDDLIDLLVKGEE